MRAEITYNHRLHSNPLFTEPFIDTDNTNQDPSNLNNSINNPDNLVPTEEHYSEESDDETDELQLENGFGEYL